MKKKIWGLVVIIIFITAFLVKSVFVSATQKETTSEEFHYRTINCYVNSCEAGFSYSEEMFLKDSRELSTDMAKMSVALAGLAYDDDNEQISNVLQTMGFEKENQSYYNYPNQRQSTLEDNDYVAFGIAHKTISYNNQDYIIYIVPVRGTPNSAEWFSNFKLSKDNEEKNDNGNHYGFYTAANEVRNEISYRISNDNIDAEHTVVLVTGHSRGAAVANIVAGQLSGEKYSANVKQEHIFGYTYACPSVSKNADNTLKNIYNFNNKGDIVPLLPRETWGYKRFGQSIDLDLKDWNNVCRRFQDVCGKELFSLKDSSSYETIIDNLIVSKKDFYNSDNQILLGMVAYFKCGGTVSFDELVIHYGIDVATCIYQIANSFIDNNILILDDIDNLSNKINTLKIFIDNGLAETITYTDEEFKEWLEKDENKSIIDEIENQFYINIDSRGDLIIAANLSNKTQATIVQFVQVFKSISDLGFENLANVFQSHQIETYTIWINSMYFGTNGWTNSDVTKINTNKNVKITSIGENCFYGCVNLANKFEEIITDDICYIGEYAFYECYNMTGKLTIGEKIEKIGRSTFANCSKIEVVIIPISVEYWGSTTWDGSFLGCTGIKELHYKKGKNNEGYMYNSYNSVIGSSTEILEKVTIEEGITNISSYAFEDCIKLTEIELPQTLKTIENYAFINCEKLNMENYFNKEQGNLEYIGEGAFRGCKNIAEKLILGGKIKTICLGVFQDCTEIKELEIKDNVEEIGWYAFTNCNKIEKVIIPISVKYCGISADNNSFYGCTGIKELYYKKGKDNEGYMYDSNSSIIISSKEILEKVTIEEGITNISECAFQGCTNLTIIELPQTIKSIESCAFQNCTKLTNIELSQTLKTIENYAFANCEKLNMENYFNKEQGNLEYIGEGAFRGCKNIAEKLVLGGKIKTICLGAFQDCTEIKELEIKDNVEEIGWYAFTNCNKIEKVIIPISVKYCGINADNNSFYGCTGIKELYYKKGKDNEGYMYDSNSSVIGSSFMNLEKVTIEEGITNISECAFQGCTNLTIIELPQTIESIESYAFANCEKLNMEKYFNKEQGNLEYIGEGSFNGCKNIAEKLILGGKIKTICLGAFQNCTEIKELEIKDNVEEIGWYAFTNCNKIEKVIIPISVKYCGINADNNSFYGCTGIKELYYKKGKNNEDYMYDSNSSVIVSSFMNLEKVTIEEGIINISECAFQGCTNLTIIELPQTIETIGSYAFQNCTKLTNIELPQTLKSIENYVFTNCEKLNKVTIFSKTVEFGEAVFANCNNNLTIYGYKNSDVEKYANEQKINFISLDVEEENVKIISEEYIVEETTISRIAPNTTVSNFINKMNIDENITVTDKNGNQLKDTDIVATGMKAQIENELEYIIIVTGDIDGDAKTTINDLSKLKLHLIKKNLLADIEVKAADLDGESTITINDLARLKLILLGKILLK